MNIEIRSRELPFEFLFISNLNSKCNFCIINILINENREGKNQKYKGNKKSPIMVLIQFNDNIPVDGSNTENKFVIIFNLFDLNIIY